LAPPAKEDPDEILTKEQLEYLKHMFDEDFVKELVREDKGIFKALYSLFSKNDSN
jgi:hypothetical protein